MRYAYINGEREEATKGAKGICRTCGAEVFAKDGDIRINHWSHKGNRKCDKWQEPQEDWHIDWQDLFLKEWHEENIEKDGTTHRADILTPEGWVIELQHSPLSLSKISEREDFYGKMVWVIDGLRLPKDKPRFYKAVEDGGCRTCVPNVTEVLFDDESRIIRAWRDCSNPVFFDFGGPNIWCMLAFTVGYHAHVFRMAKDIFVNLHKEGKFDEWYNNVYLDYHNRLTEDFKAKREASEARRRFENRSVLPNELRGLRIRHKKR